MRVLCWNVAHNREIWAALEALRDSEGFDVALLQEVARPVNLPAGVSVYPDPGVTAVWETALHGYPRAWRTAVAWWGDAPVEPIPTGPLHQVAENDDRVLPESCPGAFTAVRVGETVLVSFYGVWEHLGPNDQSYSIASVHRSISDLTRLWFGRSRQQVVIAGDWNVWHAYDATSRADLRQWVTRSATVFQRLEAEGLQLVGPFGEEPLEQCPCASSECKHVQTFWYQRKAGATPYQVDYVVTTRSVGSALKPRVVPLSGGWPDASLWPSDHAPICFDIS